MIANDKNVCIFSGFRENNIYVIDLLNLDCDAKYFATLNEDS